MGRVVIANVVEASASVFPAMAGVSASGSFETKAVVGEPNRPLLLWQHVLSPGSEIRWHRPPVGHAVYVWSGTIEVDGHELRQDGALFVAHGGQATLHCGSGPAVLLHFCRPENSIAAASRPGGCVHVVNKDAARYYRRETPVLHGHVFADSGCPTCELWLHKSECFSATSVPRHFHTSDEIIFVVGGEMTLGRRKLTAGTAVAIDANTVYQFGTGEKGLSFINFRAVEPFAAVITPEGTATPLISERLDVAELVARTQSRQAAAH